MRCEDNASVIGNRHMVSFPCVRVAMSISLTLLFTKDERRLMVNRQQQGQRLAGSLARRSGSEGWPLQDPPSAQLDRQ